MASARARAAACGEVLSKPAVTNGVTMFNFLNRWHRQTCGLKQPQGPHRRCRQEELQASSGALRLRALRFHISGVKKKRFGDREQFDRTKGGAVQ